MSSEQSVTVWISRLKAGDQAAAQPLWDRYFRAMARLARDRLRAFPRRAVDEEDIALSAFDSFCRGATAHDVLRQVRELDAPPPRALAPGVDGDLEAVCLKCLQREPTARYASAAALADDLERWLRGEPVSVRPPGVWEWLRQEWRNRPPPFAYTWPSLVWHGLAILVSSGMAFAIVRLGGSALWVWAVLLSTVVGHWQIASHYLMRRFRMLGPAERHSLMITVGNLAANMMLFAATVPFRSSASAREILPVYPSLILLNGLALFVIGSTHWGRLFPVALGLMALAPLLAWLPEWSPLIYGSAVSASLWWWAYCVRRYFGPRVAPDRTRP
jgi:serine/threonine-protein kinase